jgi:hypothetical protein
MFVAVRSFLMDLDIMEVKTWCVSVCVFSLQSKDDTKHYR